MFKVNETKYSNYFWKNGIPVGFTSVPFTFSGISYKIVSDPYHKRISIEKYEASTFLSVVYDSMLLNFRHLKNPEQAAWQKSTNSLGQCFIRDQDDRLLFIETYQFEKDLCIGCQTHSPHGLFLSEHRIYYKILNHSLDGVVLYDSNSHPVMYKLYTFDATTRQFTTLTQQEWNMEGLLSEEKALSKEIELLRRSLYLHQPYKGGSDNESISHPQKGLSTVAVGNSESDGYRDSTSVFNT